MSHFVKPSKMVRKFWQVSLREGSRFIVPAMEELRGCVGHVSGKGAIALHLRGEKISYQEDLVEIKAGLSPCG
jgi:hypothetical protein